MFIVLLKFSDNKSRADEFMEDHNQWVKQGFNDGVFLLAGSLQPGLGGAILAEGISEEKLQLRVNQDPFVMETIVKPEILEIDPKIANEHMQFLLS